MAGRVDEVKDVPFPINSNVLGLNGDSAFAFQLHRIEVLGTHRSFFNSAGDLQNTVR